jgi:hypothetical protein
MRFRINILVEDRFVEQDYAYSRDELEKDLKREIMDMELGIIEMSVKEVEEK